MSKLSMWIINQITKLSKKVSFVKLKIETAKHNFKIQKYLPQGTTTLKWPTALNLNGYILIEPAKEPFPTSSKGKKIHHKDHL